MRPVMVKAYGWLKPAHEDCAKALEEALAQWYVTGAIELEGQLLRVAHEGEYFPAEDVMAALRPFLDHESEGKLDIMDLEAWTLIRYTWPDGVMLRREDSLNRALEKSCGR